MALQIILLTVGFIALTKGADWLVRGSVSLAKNYKVSELAIGLTIVAFGTSAPELVVNVVSSFKGLNDVTMGNIVGSNIFNLMLILGLAGLIYPLNVQVKTIWNEIPFSLLAAIVLVFLGNFSFKSDSEPSISRLEGSILIFLFLLFIVYIVIQLRKKEDVIEAGYLILKPSISLLLIATGITLLIAGSRLVIDNAVKMARDLGVSEKIIGITVISVGTSLPELVTSIVATIRKKSDIAIGNIIGSNIFNILLILGVCSFIAPIKYNTSFNQDIFLLIVATLLLFFFMFSGKKYKLDRWESAMLLVGYIGYIYFLLR